MAGVMLIVQSILFTLKTGFTYKELKGRELNEKQIQTKKWWYCLEGIHISIFLFLYFLTGKEFVILQYFDLLLTYMLLAVVDIKKHMIPNRILLCMGIGQFLYRIMLASITDFWKEIALGVVIYVILLLLSIASKNGLGLGDAKLLALTAVFTGSSYLLQMIFWGLLCAFIYSVFLLAYKKGNRKTELPFVPFLACGMLIHVGVWLLL